MVTGGAAGPSGWDSEGGVGRPGGQGSKRGVPSAQLGGRIGVSSWEQERRGTWVTGGGFVSERRREEDNSMEAFVKWLH